MVTKFLIQAVRLDEGCVPLFVLPVELRTPRRALWTCDPQEAQRFDTREAAEAFMWPLRAVSAYDMTVREFTEEPVPARTFQDQVRETVQDSLEVLKALE